MRIEHLIVQHVHFMPEEIFPGILYVSKEFETVLHLCACGCGSEVFTPITNIPPNNWVLEETADGPTLRPSVGSFQLPCRSHYCITKGRIMWC
jgi:hypothetical protein